MNNLLAAGLSTQSIEVKTMIWKAYDTMTLKVSKFHFELFQWSESLQHPERTTDSLQKPLQDD